jgi:CRP/FNR family cyclic AMP-dependent transcriptional regulator
MAADLTINSIADVPLFHQFGSASLERLSSIARIHRFGPDQIIFKEGDASTKFYVIRTGHVALEIAATPRTLRIRNAGPGDEVGWSALLPGRGKQLQAHSLTEVEAFAFEGSELLKLCEEDPKFGFELMHHLLGLVADRLEATRLQLSDYYSPDAKRSGA